MASPPPRATTCLLSPVRRRTARSLDWPTCCPPTASSWSALHPDRSGHVPVTRSAGLPQFDPIALRISDPAESTDFLHLLGLLGHVRALGAQLGEHRVQVTDTEVEHRLLGAGAEVIGVGLERREHRRPDVLVPQAVLIGGQSQVIAIPGTQGDRVGSPQEVPTHSQHTFHLAILPGRTDYRPARTARPGRGGQGHVPEPMHFPGRAASSAPPRSTVPPAPTGAAMTALQTWVAPAY